MYRYLKINIISLSVISSRMKINNIAYGNGINNNNNTLNIDIVKCVNKIVCYQELLLILILFIVHLYYITVRL